MMTYILLVAGIVLLIKGAGWLVEGSSVLAKRFGISSLIVGLTIVAFGTSAPELVVSLVAAFGGSTDVAFGNIIGSNIANILLVLGIAAILFPPRLKRTTVWREIPFSLLAVLVLFTIANDFIIDALNVSSLTRVDGLILLFFFAIFVYYLFELARRDINTNTIIEEHAKRRGNKVVGVLIVAGMLGLYLGGKWVVEGAVSIAQQFGASQFLIAATVIAIGTSLPELATTISAVRKKNTDLAVGNIIGSNIFNIFWILGITSLVAPIEIPSFINTDIIFLLVITALLFTFMFIGKRHKLERWQGILFVFLYLAYIIFIIVRG